jgi:hypothetical protein
MRLLFLASVLCGLEDARHAAAHELGKKTEKLGSISNACSA